MNPAVYGMPVCRYHGARRPETIRKGANHPQYKHGRETNELRADRRAGIARIEALIMVMRLLGMSRTKS